jgi:hypothetical protein
MFSHQVVTSVSCWIHVQINSGFSVIKQSPETWQQAMSQTLGKLKTEHTSWLCQLRILRNLKALICDAAAWRRVLGGGGGENGVGRQQSEPTRHLIGELVKQDANRRQCVLAGYGSPLREPGSRYDEGPAMSLGRERRVRLGRPLAAGDATGQQRRARQGRPDAVARQLRLPLLHTRWWLCKWNDGMAMASSDDGDSLWNCWEWRRLLLRMCRATMEPLEWGPGWKFWEPAESRSSSRKSTGFHFFSPLLKNGMGAWLRGWTAVALRYCFFLLLR